MKAVIVVVIVVIVALIALVAMSDHTAVTIAPLKSVGIATPVTVTVVNPHGIRRVSAYLEQNGARHPLYDESAKASRIFWSRHTPPRTITFDAGKNKAPNLKEGKARLVVEAVSDDLRGDTNSTSYDVNVVLAAPRVI